MANDFDDLLKWPGSFRAAESNVLGEYQDFNPKVVIPLQDYPNSPEKGSLLQEDKSTDGWIHLIRRSGSDKDRAYCGWRSVSHVFRVKIDEDHHKLLEEPWSLYARMHSQTTDI